MNRLTKPLAIGGTCAAALAVIAAAAPATDPAADPHAHHGEGMAHNMVHDGAANTKVEIPEYVDNFRLTDHTGQAHELYYDADAEAVVVITHGNGCPIVRNASADIAALQQRFAGDNVRFYMLNSNLQDDRAEVAAEAAEYGFELPILMDEEQLIGESLGVTRTAEVFVLDPQDGYKVVYHGPLNDRQTFERQKAEADENYVADALTAMLAGEQVETRDGGRIPGCIVRFPEREKREQHSSISYAHDVAPILLEKCADCHVEGGIGPWAMTDYQTVAGWAPMMREVIRTGRMPPWHADPHYGEFVGDRSLSPEQKKTLVHWIEAGTPRGDGPDPLAEQEMVAADWPLGEPDLILTIPAFEVPESGVVDYQYPVVANPLTEPKWLRASTYKVGSRETVHHVLSGYISELDEDGRQTAGDWEFSTGGYAVGAESQVRPDNVGVPLPAGGYIGFQMHYTPVGKPATDVTQVGLYFHEDTPELIERTAVILDASIEIPPGEARHEERAYMVFPHDAILTSAFPHAHYRGYASDLILETPDGERQTLLSLPRYDFNWQREYKFEEPVNIPAGSKLIANYIYDNSPNNFANPDPEKRIVWGDQSYEEMLYTSLTYRWKGETTANLMPEKEEALERGRYFYVYDDNMDGLIQEAELKGMTGTPLRPHFALMDQNQDGGVDKAEFEQAMAYIRQQRQQSASAQSGN